MRSNLRKRLDNLYDTAEGKYRAYRAKKTAKMQVKRMNGGYSCRKEYREQVLPFWKKYGVKPGIIWYKLWCAKGQKIDPRYIPDSLWVSTIVPYFSNSRFRRSFEDKCYHGKWFSDVKRPETVAMNIAGVYYDKDYNMITKEEAADKCVSYGRFLIKPSIDSGEGRLIRFFDRDSLTRETMLEAFDSFGANFLAQEVVPQHPALSSLNPDSINTIRIISFLYKGEVHILSSVLRMGASGARVDNFGAGGYASRILEGGRLNPEGLNKKMDWVTETHTGVKFADVTVPAYDRVVEIIKQKHPLFGHFKLIGWDFAVNTDGEPVFIEYNVCPGPNQFLCGPTFGDMTEEVLDDVFITRTYANGGN